MKKTLLAMLLAPIGLASVFAQGEPTAANPGTPPPAVRQTGPETPENGWDFFQLGFWFDVPSSTANTDVYGLKVGAPFCSGRKKVCGLETAVFCGATDKISGLQACILTSVSKRVDGMQFSIVNYAEEVNGLQLGVVNVATKKGLQVGIVNYVEDGVIPVMIIANWKF